MALAMFACSSTPSPGKAIPSAATPRPSAHASNRTKNASHPPPADAHHDPSGGLTARPATKKQTVDMVLPRRKAGCLNDPQRSPVMVTPDVLQSLFKFPLAVASQKLGLSATTIKKLCRKLGISKWPYKSPARSGTCTSRARPAGSDRKEEEDHGGSDALDNESKGSTPHTMPSSPQPEEAEEQHGTVGGQLLLHHASPAQQDREAAAAKQSAMMMSLVNDALMMRGVMQRAGTVEQVQELLKLSCAGGAQAPAPEHLPPMISAARRPAVAPEAFRIDIMSIDAIL